MSATESTSEWTGTPPVHMRADGWRIWSYLIAGVVLVLFSIMILLAVLIPTRFGPAMMYGYSNPLGWMGALIGLLSVILVLGWVLRLVALGAPQPSYGPRFDRPMRWDRAYAIARTRYARGEISREQYENIRRDLERSSPMDSVGST